MRDLRKIKSKYEFKLDNKQIAFLLVGVLVVLVVVFALGVVVGKGLVQIQSIEAGLDLKQQVETTTPPLVDIEMEPAIEAMTPEPTLIPSDEDGYVNILTGTPETTMEVIPDPIIESEPTPAPTPEPAMPAQTGGSFTIQLSSHPNKAEASNAQSKYLAQGLTDVYTVSSEVKGQTWYRVRTGAFATKEGAQQLADAIVSKGIVADPWVTTK